jgi:sugar O-acyltransferase (sialic acid O-acetyltransferase NeuD family)
MYLYGASGHCKVIIEILRSENVAIEAVHDDNAVADTILGVPVRPVSFSPLYESIISIGNNSIRKKIAEKLNTRFAVAIHKSAIVSPSSTVGKGTVVMAGAAINADSVIGSHCIINTGAVVEHDCTIGDYAHISPNAALAGNVSVGEGTQIGIGSAVIQGVKIGKWVTVGAGCVIIRDVPDYAIVVGNPGRIIKYNSEIKD